MAEDLAVVGPWNEEPCPRCGGDADRITRLAGPTLHALRCGSCGLHEIGRSLAEAERNFMRHRGRFTLGNHPEVHWEAFAASAMTHDGDQIPRSADGSIKRVFDDPKPPAGVSVDLSFGYKNGTSGARIPDPNLRAKVVRVLSDGAGRVLGDVLRWKIPDS